MNAIDFLIKEHNQVRNMLTDISDSSHHYETQRKKFGALATDLIRHEEMEQQVWYPHFKDKLPDTVKHLVKEEKTAEREINKLDELKTEAAWKEHFLKFKGAVEHHADEEERDLFPEVMKILSEKELQDIGLQMHEFKMNYLQEQPKVSKKKTIKKEQKPLQKPAIEEHSSPEKKWVILLVVVALMALAGFFYS